MVKNSGVVLWGMNESRLRLLDLDDLEYKDEDFWKHEKSYRKSVKLEKINWTYICTVVFICWQVWQINFSWMSWYKITNLIIILGTFQTKYWWGPSPSMTIVSWCININSITARNCGYKKNCIFKNAIYLYRRSILNLLQTDPMSSLNEVSS